MKRQTTLLASLALSTLSVLYAQKPLTPEETQSEAFRPKVPEGFRFMKDAKHYTQLKRNARGASLVMYRLGRQRQVDTLLNSQQLPDPTSLSEYCFSPDEKEILLSTWKQKRFRRSRQARYYRYNRRTRRLSLVDEHIIREPTFSPDSKKLAYVFESNLYIRDLKSGQTRQITTDGRRNHIINGVTDWVYEEEFAYVRAFEWSPDSKTIAYLKFDESEVPNMRIPVYGPEKRLYPGALAYAYPKAGEKNPKVTAYYYDLAKDETKQVDLSAYRDYYIPKLQWTAHANQFALFLANRHQNSVDLLSVDRRDQRVKKLLTEMDPKYIETDNLYAHFLKDNSFVWQSERDGYRHLYYYSAEGQLKHKITNGDWVVTKVCGVDERHHRVYYQSTQDGSINRSLYSIGLNGKHARKLNRRIGANEAYFTRDFKYYLNTYSTANRPPVYTLSNTKTAVPIRVVEDNHELVKRLKPHELPKVTYFRIPIPSGEKLNAWMIKPPHFDPQKRYPVLLYVYGGPGSQTALNTWGLLGHLWFEMLAQKGFIVASVDNRGTGGRGAVFKKMTYLQLGKYETQDQIDAARFLRKKPFVDADRIGIFGWSYGGFMASLCITKGADTFKSAIAVAPVTRWRYYDSIYTERYMRSPQENPKGYEENSPLHYADKLKGDYLLIAGTRDDNVHFQNALQMDEALVQADKTFSMQVYKDRDHNLMGGNTRVHLYCKMTRFLLQHLGREMKNHG